MLVSCIQPFRFRRIVHQPVLSLLLFMVGLVNLSAAQSTSDEPLFGTMDTNAILNRLLGRAAQYEYDPPDANRDGRIDVADVVMTILHNPPEDEAQYVPRIDLSLSRPDPQGTRVDLSWEVHGVDDPDDYAVFLRAHTPAVVTTGTLAVQPGMAPATGNVFYLQPAGSSGPDHDIWGMAALPYAVDGATSRGLATALLYADMPGEWVFEAQLVPTTTTLAGQRTFGDVVVSDMDALLLADVPALRLSVSRSIANSVDEITADLTVVAGTQARTIRLYGWLTLPDGTDLTVPGFERALHPLFVGTSADETHRLLRRSLGEWGEGRFVVHAAMYDEVTSRLLSLAQAPVWVSDAPTTVTGQVRALVYDDWSASEIPAPLDGPTFERARVRVLDVDDLVTLEADIDSSGTYRLSLPPGRYLLGATVRDGWTNHEASLATPLALEGGADLVEDFTLDSLTTTTGSVAQPALLKSAWAGPRLAQTSTSPVTKPRLYVMIQRDYAEGQSPECDAMVARQVDRLRERMPGVEIVTSDDVRDLLRRAAELEQNNQPNLHLIEEIATAQSTRSMLAITAVDRGDNASGGDFFFQPKLFDIGAGSVVWRGPVSWTDNANDVMADIDGAMARDGAALEQDILRRNPVPARPRVTLALSDSVVQAGGTLEVRVTLTDEADGVPVDGKTVTVLHKRGPDYRTVLRTMTGVTGTSGPGQFTVELHAPHDAAVCEVEAVFEREGQSWSDERPYSILEPNAGTALRVEPSLAGGNTWLPGGLGSARFKVLDGAGHPIGGVRVQAEGVNCHLTSDEAVSDTTYGSVSFNFYAGNRNGHAAVHASCVLPGDPSTVHRAGFTFQVLVDPEIQISPTRPQTQSLGSPNRVRMFSTAGEEEGLVPLYVTVCRGEDALPAVPVSLYVEGEGSILGARSNTDLYGVSYVSYLPPQYQTGTARIIAAAQVGDELTTSALDLDYDPGLVMEAHVPDLLDENGNGMLMLRVGRPQESSDPVWEAGIRIDIAATGGTASMPTGTTDAAGRFSSPIHLDEGSDRIQIVVTALSGDQRTATRNIIAMPSGRAYIHSMSWVRERYGEDVIDNQNAVSGSISSLAASNLVTSSARGDAEYGRISASTQSSQCSALLNYFADEYGGWISSSFQDQLLINHPARTGQQGSGRYIVHYSSDLEVGGYWDPHYADDIYMEQYNGSHAGWSFYFEPHSVPGVVYKIKGKTILHEQWEERSDSARYGSPAILPFTFTYGEPHRVSFSSWVSSSAAAYGYGPTAPWFAFGEADFTCTVEIVLDDTEATMETDSQHLYR